MRALNRSLILFLGAISFLSGCKPLKQTPPPSAVWSDYQAQNLAKEKKVEEALDLYSQMLEVVPQSPSTHANIGTSLYLLKQKEQSLKSLIYALQRAQMSKDEVSQFAIHFNLGVYYSDSDLGKALSHYQEALKIIPWHYETRHNIELLFQQSRGGGGGEGQNNDQQKQSDQQNGQGGSGQQNQDQKQQDQKDQNQNKDQNENKEQEQQGNSPKTQNSGPYKPRPFQGEKLSEGDVNKILGELKNQEQKIRSHFDKKEKKDSRNDKDW